MGTARLPRAIPVGQGRPLLGPKEALGTCKRGTMWPAIIGQFEHDTEMEKGLHLPSSPSILLYPSLSLSLSPKYFLL